MRTLKISFLTATLLTFIVGSAGISAAHADADPTVGVAPPSNNMNNTTESDLDDTLFSRFVLSTHHGNRTFERVCTNIHRRLVKEQRKHVDNATVAATTDLPSDSIQQQNTLNLTMLDTMLRAMIADGRLPGMTPLLQQLHSIDLDADNAVTRDELCTAMRTLMQKRTVEHALQVQEEQDFGDHVMNIVRGVACGVRRKLVQWANATGIEGRAIERLQCSNGTRTDGQVKADNNANTDDVIVAPTSTALTKRNSRNMAIARGTLDLLFGVLFLGFGILYLAVAWPLAVIMMLISGVFFYLGVVGVIAGLDMPKVYAVRAAVNLGKAVASARRD